MSTLTHKLAVVTGGASGIGRAIGKQLTARGATVILADNDEALVHTTAGEMGAQAKVVDVRDAEAVKQLVDDSVADHGHIDYLFNNAGIAIAGEAYDLSLDDWNRIIDINIRGVVHGVHAAYPIMRDQGFGHIVNTASVAGLAPAPMLTAYAMTKHAVVGLSRGLRAEAKAFGVKVSVVCPGIIDTPIKDNMKAINYDNKTLTENIPVKMMTADTCAEHIMRGVERNKQTIVVTMHGRALDRLQRFLPGLADRVSALAATRTRKTAK
jgi:NAD(P)-dependent dehydrogenase (short-subunit alcohol dehydrogenase family)